MSYQDIYKGMVKQASAEQVKELAGLISLDKKAGLKKQAVPRWMPALFTGKVKMPSGIPDADWKMGAPARWISGLVTKHPDAAKKLGYGALAVGGASVPTLTYLWGNSGKSALKDALDRSNTQLQKTTDALNKAKKGTGSFWGDLGNTFRWLIERFGKLFKSSPAETPKVPTTTK